MFSEFCSAICSCHVLLIYYYVLNRAEILILFFFFLFLFFLHSIQRPFNVARIRKNRVRHSNFGSDDPPIRDYRSPKTVLVSSRFLVKLLESTKRTPCSVVELTGFQLRLREMKYVFVSRYD